MEHRAEPQIEGPGADAQELAKDDLLAVISQVERQLETLKSAQAEREQMRARLEGWAAELTERENSMRDRAQAIAAQQAQLEGQRTRFEEECAELVRARERARGEFDALSQEQRRSAAEHETKMAELASQAQQLTRREEVLARKMAALEKQEHQLAERLGILSRQEATAQSTGAELQGLREQLREQAQRLEAAERQAADRTSELRASQGASEAAAAQLEQVGRALSEARGAAQRQAEQFKAQLAELQAQHERSQNPQASAAGQDRSDAAAFEQQLAQRDARIQELDASLQQTRAQLKDVSEVLAKKAAIIEQARELAVDLRDKEARIQELEATLADLQAASASEPAGTNAAQALAAQVSELRSELQAAGESISSAQEESRRWRSLAEQAHNAGAGAMSADNASVALRQRRLRQLRTLMREQHEKLRSASEAMRERMKEVEQVKAEREQLARIRAALMQSKREMSEGQSKATGRKAAMLASCVVLVVCGLLAFSWMVAGQVAPATYAARSVLSADISGGLPGADLLAEWQRYHESLVSDPSMMQVGAERMSRRGIVSLGTPGQLAERLTNHLDIQSPQDGLLVFELRGWGGTKTARELEVFVTAVASQANATRERRADGLGTLIDEPAAAGEPVSDARVMYAGGIFGLGTTLASLIGFTAWRRMSAVKAKFEDEIRAEATADEARWTEAPKLVGRPRT